MNESFIHSSFDEAGLTPVEFRVFAHVLRRAGRDGDCYAGAVSMARVCRVNVKTLRRTLRSLASYGILTRDERAGQETIHKPASPDTWRAPYSKQHHTQPDTGVSKREGRLPKRIPGNPTHSDTPKVYPSEVSLKKGERSPPDSLRREGKQRLYPRELDKLIADAKLKTKELRQTGAGQDDPTVKALREKIRAWESEKLGVELPAKAPTVKLAAKPDLKSDLTLDAVLAVASERKVEEAFARAWFADNEHDPTTARSDWRATLTDSWYFHGKARR